MSGDSDFFLFFSQFSQTVSTKVILRVTAAAEGQYDVEGKRCIQMPGPGYRIFSRSAGSWLTGSVAPFVMNPSILVSTIDIVISSLTPETETVGWDGKGKLLT